MKVFIDIHGLPLTSGTGSSLARSPFLESSLDTFGLLLSFLVKLMDLNDHFFFDFSFFFLSALSEVAAASFSVVCCLSFSSVPSAGPLTTPSSCLVSSLFCSVLSSVADAAAVSSFFTSVDSVVCSPPPPFANGGVS